MTDDNEIAEVLNDLFVTVFTKESVSIPEPKQENNTTLQEITINEEKTKIS